MLFPAAVCALAAVTRLVTVTDLPRPPRSEALAADLANPYKGSSTLLRIHAVSVLLVVPQALVWTFTLVWLIAERGWSPTSAGVLVMVSQILGAAGRIVAGRWSDRVGSRLRLDPGHRRRRGKHDGTAGGDRCPGIPGGAWR